MIQSYYVDKYRALIDKIEQIESSNKNKIRLVVVSKKQDPEKIVTLRKLGQKDFGENYVDEAYEKINSIADDSITWHFIGRIQSNKIKKICDLFSWVHTISSEKHLIKINETCMDINKVMNICVQINIDCEESKDGIYFEDFQQLSSHALELKYVKLRGIMAIPRADKPPDHSFSKMSSLYHKHNYLDTLSMGMSSDFLTAIENDANMLRIGQEIFGKRI